MATGSTSPLAATAAEQEPPESVTKKQKLSYDEKVSFVIPSGDVFQISRAALSCEPFKDGLLRRLVESELPTERDANGAIKLGVECSRDAFQRVVDEYEWALQQSHNEWLGFMRHNYFKTCGPAIRVLINPCELHAVYEFLGLPSDTFLDVDRLHHGSPIPLLAAQRALIEAWKLAPQVDCFFRALELTISMVPMVDLSTSTTPARIRFAITDFEAPIKNDHDFTTELFQLLQNEDALAELVRVFLPDQVDRFTGVKLRPFNDVSADDRLRVYDAMTLTRHVPTSLDVASKPIGWFAVAIPAYTLFEDKLYGSFLESCHVPLILDNFTGSLVVRFGYNHESEETELCVSYVIYPDNNTERASRHSCPFIVKLCQLHRTIDDEDDVERHKAVRELFFKDAVKPNWGYGYGVLTSNLISLEDLMAEDEAWQDDEWRDYVNSIEEERTTVWHPWQRASFGNLLPPENEDEHFHLRIDRSVVMAHEKQDREAAKQSKDGLGAADSTRFITFVFNVSETLVMPPLKEAAEGVKGKYVVEVTGC